MNPRVFLMLIIAASSLPAQVTFGRILNAAKEPQNWLTYGGTYKSQRFSQLDQITPQNANDIELKWAFQAQLLNPYETTPLVVDGIMYTLQHNDVVALDAADGKLFWIYRYLTQSTVKSAAGNISRGLAILGDTLFLATVDAHLIAIDAKNGHALWDTTVAKSASGYAMTLAPLVIKDKVLVGVAGGEYGIRGFIAAYDAKTGKQDWKFYTIPGPGEPGNETWGGDSWMHGGASVWVTGSYDPDLNLTYWGIGNAGPDFNGDVRPGDNLYSSSVVALDADTGKIKWHYQFSPHNEFDWDAVQVPVLADLTWQGNPRKVMLWGNRNAFFYVLDRTSGQFLSATPFAKQTWNIGFDERGRPMLSPSAQSSREGTLVYPGVQGATNWYSPSFSPLTNLFYLTTWDNYSAKLSKGDVEYVEGENYGGGGGRGRDWAPQRLGVGMGWLAPQGPNLKKDEEGYGAVRALDPLTGERKWEFKMNDVSVGGVLTTASNMLFSGNREGNFFALDARNGGLLWHIMLGGQVNMSPITYAVNGKQYVAAAAGNTLFVFGLK
jgi:alcohol dehydrogenase (cytochrome c)